METDYRDYTSFTEENTAIHYGFNFFPRKASLEAYRYILRNSAMIFRAYGVTIFTTVTGTFVSLIITSLLGYGVSKDIPGKRFLGFYFIFTMLFNGGLVPTYLVYSKYLHILETMKPAEDGSGDIILLLICAAVCIPGPSCGNRI